MKATQSPALVDVTGLPAGTAIDALAQSLQEAALDPGLPDSICALMLESARELRAASEAV